MRQLLLLRHAKSSWDADELPDRDRPLNARGRRSTVAIRKVMRDLGLQPDIVLVSTARRTLETLDLLEPWDETPLVEPMDGLYLASAAQLLAILNNVAETARAVLLIGHNPGLHELALALAGTAVEDHEIAHHEPLRGLIHGFPTGALAEFVIPGAWRELGPNKGRLARFLTPRGLESA